MKLSDWLMSFADTLPAYVRFFRVFRAGSFSIYKTA